MTETVDDITIAFSENGIETTKELGQASINQRRLDNDYVQISRLG